MKKLAFVALILCTLILADTLQAQGACPPGQYPVSGQGWNYCAPIPNYQSNEQEEQAPVPAWETRWQSYAADLPKGILGTATGLKTSDIAEQAAKADCANKGGANCTTLITSSNGCIAMVVGDEQMSSKSGATKDEAEAIALAACSKKDVHCHVYHSSCSPAARVR